MYLDEVKDTRDIKIPKNALDRVIGQARAVEKVKIAIRQRRHLLLVGPPGIGKSMIAQALALNLPKPKEEIWVVHNENEPERPLLEVVTRDALPKAEAAPVSKGMIVTPRDVPSFVAEQLGFRCPSCAGLSSDRDMICPHCGSNKFATRSLGESSPFNDIITEVFDMGMVRPEKEVRVQTHKDGRPAILIYRKIEGGRIQILDHANIENAAPKKTERKKKVLVSLNRIPFVQATGASETELLGDVRHDPFGSHPEIGTPVYMRILPGAVHEAHEGVLFIDELPHIQHLQSFILTAMQDKKFSIVGRNPHSAGASVKVANVPCDFLLVGACNIGDVERIIQPLRSRVLGQGYEILLDTVMPDTDANRMKITQFITQEIEADGRIPPASRSALEGIVKEARRRALEIDHVKDALTLRLRDLGGLLRSAGDLAILEESKLIELKHIKRGILEAKPVEHQIKESYGSLWKGAAKDSGLDIPGEGPDEGYV